MTPLTGLAVEVFLATPRAKPILFPLRGIPDCPPLQAKMAVEVVQEFHRAPDFLQSDLHLTLLLEYVLKYPTSVMQFNQMWLYTSLLEPTLSKILDSN